MENNFYKVFKAKALLEEIPFDNKRVLEALRSIVNVSSS